MGRLLNEKLLPLPMRDKSAYHRQGIRRGRRPRQMGNQPDDQRRLGPPISCNEALSTARFPA